MKEYAYSLDEELFCYDSIQEAVDDWLSDNDPPLEGEVLTIWKGDVVRPKLSKFVDGQGIVESIAECIWDNCGEYVDYYCEDLNSTKDLHQLEQLVADWLEKRHPITFYSVENIEAVEVGSEYFN